jgi:hypothetical protein
MPDPVHFTLQRHGDLWRLERDGHEQGVYSHVDQGVHEAVQRARALQESGEPATVSVLLEDGKRLEVEVGPEGENPDLAGNARAFTPTKPL